MALRPDSWPRVREVFEGALARPAAERSAYVVTACGSDETLRQEVERLLAAHDRADSFLETPAAALLDDAVVTRNLEGHQLGPYQLTARIDAGGMGEVYKARDTRLDRTVAIKVLPAHAAASPRAQERFEREARAVAALNHPNICTLHDIGHQEGVDFLVMEYVDGETLAARLANGPLQVAQALDYAVQIASALDTAHRAGIVHRDLKPRNVMLTKAGAKLLDFGLAKACATGVAGGLTRLPAPDLTTPGTILGTVQYMAPEQLEGKETDARTDIFAFGAVLFEMITGRKAFEGRSQASLIAAILEREPPAPSALQPLVTAPLDRIVKTCLAKDPDDRWQTARDLLRELKWIAAGVPVRGIERETDVAAAAPNDREIDQPFGKERIVETSDRRPSARWRPALAMVLGVVVLLGLVLVGLFRARSPVVANADAAAREYPKRLTNNIATDAQPDWSPDGRRIVFASSREGRPDIYVMDTDGSHVTNLTNNPANDLSPEWSPDGKLIAFESDRAPGSGIYVMAADGSSPRRLVDTRAQGGRPSWAPDGKRIAFMSGPKRECEIYVINVDGTGLTQITHNDLFDGDPAWSPDGRKIAFTRNVDGNLDIYVMDADGANQTRLTFSPGYDSVAAWSPDGRRIAFQSDRDGGEEIYVMAADGSDPVRITHTLKTNGEVSWSPDGTKLAFHSSRDGNAEIYVTEAIPDTATRCTSSLATESSPSWSPDGSRLVFSSNREHLSGIYMAACGEPPVHVDTGPGAARQPVWSTRGDRIAFFGDRDGHDDVYVLAGGTVKNLTHGLYNLGGGLAWSPDGSRLALSTSVDGGGEIVILDAAGGFLRRIAHSARMKHGLAWSPDGSHIAFAAGPHEDGPYNFEIYVIGADGSRERRLTTHPAYDGEPTWSPDGRRIAFISERSGDRDVYVMNADGSSLTRVTHTPWAEVAPAWSPDGRHLALASGPYGNLDIYVYDLADILPAR